MIGVLLAGGITLAAQVGAPAGFEEAFVAAARDACAEPELSYSSVAAKARARRWTSLGPAELRALQDGRIGHGWQGWSMFEGGRQFYVLLSAGAPLYATRDERFPAQLSDASVSCDVVVKGALDPERVKRRLEQERAVDRRLGPPDEVMRRAGGLLIFGWRISSPAPAARDDWRTIYYSASSNALHRIAMTGPWRERERLKRPDQS